MRALRQSHGGGYTYGGRLYQTDWDFPQLAEDLGWSLRRVQRRGRSIVHLQAVRAGRRNCDHRGTDGTVTCPDCGITVGEFITRAAEYLDARTTY